MLAYASICWHMLAYAGICWHMKATVSISKQMLASMCWYMLADGSIRKHMLPGPSNYDGMGSCAHILTSNAQIRKQRCVAHCGKCKNTKSPAGFGWHQKSTNKWLQYKLHGLKLIAHAGTGRRQQGRPFAMSPCGEEWINFSNKYKDQNDATRGVYPSRLFQTRFF